MSNPNTVWGFYRRTIDDAIKHQPRSLQRRIGPSEIGSPCTHCLAAKLAGWQQVEETAWLPFIGTAVHAQLEEIFTKAGPAWETETRVTVGDINGTPITGTCDLFHVPTGTVIDHKIVGTSTLNKARREGAKPVYRVQAHLYGRGWQNKGHRITTVAIAHLPRNATSLSQAVFWSEPYDEQIALQALERVNQLATSVEVVKTLGTEKLNNFISGLDRDPDCFSCARYPDYEPALSGLEMFNTNPPQKAQQTS